MSPCLTPRRPVSYTHLDVYKRQGYVGRIKNSGAQVVQAPIQTTVSKKGTVKTGNDLRIGKK